MTKFTVEQLAAWILTLKEFAENDTENVTSWFAPTAGEPFSIVGGWHKLPTVIDCSNIFCCSKSDPDYMMSVKIVINENGNSADFDTLNMPLDSLGMVDNTCVPLEWDDVPELAAEFFAHEWERIMETYN